MRNNHFCSCMIVYTLARVHGYNENFCACDSWLLIEIVQCSKVPLVICRHKAHRCKLLFDYQQVVWLQSSLQQLVTIVVFMLSLLLMDEKKCFTRKSFSVTVFSKTQNEKSNKKSTLGLKIPKVVSFFWVFISSFEKLL